MDMQPVSSSNLSMVGYDPDTRKLRIVFKRGGAYTYDDVPQEEYDGLMAAASAGSYFHDNIRNVYSFTRG